MGANNCAICNGSGKCDMCNGTGQQKDFSAPTAMLGIEATKPCTFCNGTGKCLCMLCPICQKDKALFAGHGIVREFDDGSQVELCSHACSQAYEERFDNSGKEI